MLRGGSILYALLIAVIVTILSLSVLYIAYYNRLYSEKFYINQELHRRAYSLLFNANNEIYNLPEKINEKYPINSNLKQNHWGAFELITATAACGTDTVTKTALCGIPMPATNNITHAAFVCNIKRYPVYLVGNTKLSGMFFFPEKGVDRGIAEAKNYTGQIPYIKGKLNKSDRDLPLLSTHFTEKTKKQYVQFYQSGDSVVSLDIYPYPDSLSNSFTHHTICYQSTQPVYIENTTLNGNIIIQSEKSITLAQTSKLTDVLLIAPQIKFEDEFTGNVHVLAKDSICTGKKVQLNYPSSLVIIENLKNEASISIGKENKISGMIIISGKTEPKQKQLISIEDETEISGRIYCPGFVQLKGKLFGSVYCTSFTLKTSFSTYENYLLDVEINPLVLSPHYLTTPLLENEKEMYKIVKWMP